MEAFSPRRYGPNVLSTYLRGQAFGESFGSAPPCVLALHGWARTHEDFRVALSGLGADRPALDAIALDLPGFGASPPPPEAWGAAQYAEAISPILDDMAKPVVVVGHSFGGRVAIELAIAAKDRLRGLVLIGVPLVPSKASAGRTKTGYKVVRTLVRAGILGEAQLERARQRYGSRDYREANGVMRSVLVRVLTEDYTDALRQIACPTELLWGAKDTVAPPWLARDALRMLKDGHLTELPGVDHFVPTAAPSAVYEAVKSLQR
jgi:pimeloyl-ACP methyl ester carboxylesterase